jgi:hypothetical protein
VAAGLCGVIFPTDSIAVAHLGLPLPAAWASTGVVLLTEFVLTYLLMTSIFGTAIDERGRGVKIGGFGIGLTVTFDILAGGAVSGASMNPARSFGPAVQLMYWQWHWVYRVAPIAGACCAALVYEHLLLERVTRPTLKRGDRRSPATREVVAERQREQGGSIRASLCRQVLQPVEFPTRTGGPSRTVRTTPARRWP